MNVPPSPAGTWWVLAGLSNTEQWTPAERRWAAAEQKKLRPLLPRAVARRLDGIVVDWDSRADARLLREIRPGDALIAITRHGDGRWYTGAALRVLARDTFWRPSMRRTSMLTVERPAGEVDVPLTRVIRALAREGVKLRRGGMQSYPVTDPATREVVARTFTVASMARLLG